MSNISILSSLINGVQRNVDLSANTLVVGSVMVGGGSGTALTKTILDGLIALQTNLASTTGGAAGSTYVGDDDSYSNFTPTAATVKGALEGIDSALAAVSGGAANQDLSNLTSPTSINQDLIPSGTTKVLGSSADYWSQAWIKTILYPSAISFQLDTGALFNGTGSTVADFANLLLKDNADFLSIDWDNRLLADSAGATQLEWSTAGISVTNALNMNSNKISGLASGTTSGDAVEFSQLANYIPTSEKGANNGVATLDAGGKIPVSQLPNSVMTYEGTWDASTNTPTLADGTGNAGMVYLTSVAGTVDFGSGPIDFNVGDWVVYSGAIWQKSENSDSVVSVNGQTGVVTINAINQLTGDVTATAASGSVSKATTVAAIQGTAVAGTTGSGNVVFSTSPTFTGTIVAAAANLSGALSASNFSGSSSGTNTGDQTITLTGDVTGSGTGSFAATIGAAKVSATQLATGAFDQKTIVGGAGTAASVAQAPLMKDTFVAGESFAANTSFVVRWALNGETAGRVYKADKDASSSQQYLAIGIALSPAGVSAGGNIDVVMLGTFTLGSSDTPFSGSAVGLELFVGSSGAYILGAALANTTNEAQFCVGSVRTTSTVWVDFKQLRGIA